VLSGEFIVQQYSAVPHHRPGHYSFLSSIFYKLRFIFHLKYNTVGFADVGQVLPVIVFLSSVVSVLFYWGVMQYLIRKLAWVMQFTMRTTAAESLNAAANIFLGMVRDVIDSML